MMALSDGRKSCRIRLAVLIQYRSVTDTQPPSHVAIAITLNALAKASSLKTLSCGHCTRCLSLKASDKVVRSDIKKNSGALPPSFPHQSLQLINRIFAQLAVYPRLFPPRHDVSHPVLKWICAVLIAYRYYTIYNTVVTHTRTHSHIH